MKKFLFLLGLVPLCYDSFAKSEKNSAYSVEYKGIIVIVNGRIITFRDLENRVKMVALSSGIKDSPEVCFEVLKEMISEEVKWSHVSKFTPKGGWVKNKEVDEAFSNIAARNNMNVKSFSKLLIEKGIDEQAFKRSIMINIAWSRYIDAKCGKNMFIPSRELRLAVENIKKKSKEESFLVSRMFFPILNPNEAVRVKSRVTNIRGMLKNGAQFAELARQFSKSADAKNGGNLGWIFEGQLSPEEYFELRKMKIGEVSVVENSRGCSILQLNDKKAAGKNVITHVTFVQVAVPRPEFTEGQDTRSLLNELKSHFPNVRDFMNQAKAIGCYVSEPISAVQEGMIPEMRESVSGCRVNGMTKVLSNEKALFVFCVLKRMEEKIPEPTVKDIKMQKLNEKFGALSDKELYELMKKADLEIKAKEYGRVSDFV